MPIAQDAYEFGESDDVATVDTLDQRYILCAEYDRDMILIETLRNYREDHEKSNVIIFTNTKQCCQVLSMTLNAISMTNVCIHGYMRHKERVAALSQFKSNRINTLIATDVAARGLDIPNVELILNHRLPKQPNEYIHRVGRTARAGRNGLAISIFRFPRDMEFLDAIENTINTKLVEHKIDERMVERIFMQVSISKREAEMKLDNTDFYDKQRNYRRINWIKDGADPGKMEENYRNAKKEKRKQYKKLLKQKKKDNTEIEINKPIDKRFKDIPLTKLAKKITNAKASKSIDERFKSAQHSKALTIKKQEKT